MKTQSWLLVRKGDAKQAFEKGEIELSALKTGQVLVEVEAFGLNYADVMARLGLYREAPPMPCTLGYEVVGVVKEVADGVDPKWIGKRVVAFTQFGGYAKHVVTEALAIAEVGDAPIADALALATQGVTAYYMASYMCPIKQGDHVLIHAAAGGVGTILIQLAKLHGATVYAKVSSEKKQLLVENYGADYSVNYLQSDYEDQIRTLLNGRRLDVSYNPVSGSTYKKDQRLIGSAGRIFLFGGSELGMSKWGILSKLNFVRKMGFMTPIALMIRSKSIIGVNMLKVAQNKPEQLAICLREVTKLYSEGKLKITSGGIFEDAQLAEAHDLLESGNSTGKIGVKWSD